jgi:hypothetical protein
MVRPIRNSHRRAGLARLAIQAVVAMLGMVSFASVTGLADRAQTSLGAGFVQSAGILAMVLPVALGGAFFLSSRSQRRAGPLGPLTEAAVPVTSGRQDFALRIAQTPDDEPSSDQGSQAAWNDAQQREEELRRLLNEMELKLQRRTVELSLARERLDGEIEGRLRAEEQLHSVRGQLAAAVRRAGLAEITKGVLNDVDNALRAIRLSATVAHRRTSGAKFNELMHLAESLCTPGDDAVERADGGQPSAKSATLVQSLALQLSQEQREIAKELDQLAAKVEHARAIVGTQQSYSTALADRDVVDVAVVVDEALRLAAPSIERYRVALTRQHDDATMVRLDRKAVVEALSKTIQSAVETFSQNEGSRPLRLVLGTVIVGNRLQMELSDQAQSHLAGEGRVVACTSCENGAASQLRDCATLARSLDGSLALYQDAKGAATTIVLEVPCRAAQVIA